jgi:hypothetical protein
LEASHSYGVFQEDVPVSLPYIPTSALPCLCQSNSPHLLLVANRHSIAVRHAAVLFSDNEGPPVVTDKYGTIQFLRFDLK